jgi:RHS repeat-associated protein
VITDDPNPPGSTLDAGTDLTHQAAVSIDYDTLHRVTDADYGVRGTEALQLDLLGNRTNYTDRDASVTTYTPDLVNAYTSITPSIVAPDHDGNGNLIQNDRDFDFEYDFENRLIRIRGPDDAVITEYAYDALGRRVKAHLPTTSDTTLYYFDKTNVACEYNFDGQTETLLRHYIHGTTYVDERAILHDAATGREYGYALNDMYSVIGLVDDLGNLLEAYHYDVFGTRYAETVSAFQDLYVAIRNRLGETVTGPDEHDLNGDLTINLLDLLLARTVATVAPIPSVQPYAFQGRRRNVHTPTVGDALVLYDYRARTYDPILGRFHQRDPAEYIDSYNLYLALGGNPLIWMDPSGENLMELLGAMGNGALMRVASAMAAGRAMAYFHTVAAAIAFRTQLLNGFLRTAERMGPRGMDYFTRAQAIMRGVNQTVFTKYNYRQAYIDLIYGPAGRLANNIQVHHIFPKTKEFTQFFQNRGIRPVNRVGRDWVKIAGGA